MWWESCAVRVPELYHISIHPDLFHQLYVKLARLE